MMEFLFSLVFLVILRNFSEEPFHRTLQGEYSCVFTVDFERFLNSEFWICFEKSMFVGVVIVCVLKFNSLQNCNFYTLNMKPLFMDKLSS